MKIYAMNSQNLLFEKLSNGISAYIPIILMGLVVVFLSWYGCSLIKTQNQDFNSRALCSILCLHSSNMTELLEVLRNTV